MCVSNLSGIGAVDQIGAAAVGAGLSRPPIAALATVKQTYIFQMSNKHAFDLLRERALVGLRRRLHSPPLRQTVGWLEFDRAIALRALPTTVRLKLGEGADRRLGYTDQGSGDRLHSIRVHRSPQTRYRSYHSEFVAEMPVSDDRFCSLAWSKASATFEDFWGPGTGSPTPICQRRPMRTRRSS